MVAGIVLLSALALAAEMPPCPEAVKPAPNECKTTDVLPGVLVDTNCYGVLISRATAANYVSNTMYAVDLIEAWPKDQKVPWYNRPNVARIEGGLLVASIVALTAYGLHGVN